MAVNLAVPRLVSLSEKVMISVRAMLTFAFPVNSTAVSCAKLALLWPVAGARVTKSEVLVATC